jgi:signal transduction histidine kinase
MDQVVQVVNAVAFGLLTLVVFRQWRRMGDAPSAWLTATFGSLALVIVVGLFLPERAEGAFEVGLTKLAVVGVVVYPFFLYRFMAAFRAPSPALEWSARLLTVAMVVFTLAIPRFPAESEPRPAWLEVYALALIAQWTVLAVAVALRFWRAGQGQPSVTRKRMRVLAVGAILLTLAILPAAAPQSRQPGALQAVAQGLPTLSVVFFMLGFVPPSALRTIWRRTEAVALRNAEVELMGVVSVQQVADALLPHVAGMCGGQGAFLVGADGRTTARYGVTEHEAVDAAAVLRTLPSDEPIIVEGQPSLIALPLRSGWLAVQASMYTPYFGAEEASLLRGLGIFTDIALERAELFEREQEARLGAELANAELETLVYGISHDLKSPLITILGYLEYLQTDHAAGLNDEGRHFLSRMTGSANYMQDLIGDLLELSRIGRVQTDPVEVDLDTLVREIADGVTAAHPEVAFEIGELPAVWLNPVRARQLFTNLVENAARHGGRSDLSIRIAATPGPRDRVEISVADDGAGIPEPYRERVFGVFERLEPRDAATVGTGVGLAICRKIVEQVGGEIIIVPSLQGTDFRMSLPRAPTQPADTKTLEPRG